MVTFLKQVKMPKPQETVKALLHLHLNGPEPARPIKRVHASELTKPEGFCPRYYALADVTQYQPKNRWLKTTDRVTFEFGRLLQDSVVNWFGDMERTMGDWQCYACHKTYKFVMRPKVCDCGCKTFRPQEMRFESAINGASCGVDMVVKTAKNKLHVTEIKTMAGDQFKNLVAPLAEHRWRTNLYMRLIEESGDPMADMIDTQEASVLYVSKATGGCADPTLESIGVKESLSPFKEFPVKRNDAETDEICARAKVVKDFREKTVGMPCGICKTPLDKRAANCELKTVCFSGDFPPKYEWSKK